MQQDPPQLNRPARWRLQRWPGDPTIAHLVFTSMLQVPDASDFERAIASAADRGAVAIRTSALFPTSQVAAAEAGFAPIDTLALLRVPIGQSTDTSNPTVAEVRRFDRPLRTQGGRSNVAVTIGPLWSWHLGAAAAIDRLAFGDDWGNSASSLHQILSATLRARARLARIAQTRVGFALCGTTGDTGFIQRLAVHPDFRRRGVARRLVIDGLGWIARSGANNAFVNTSVDNTAALELYRSLGFVDTGEVMTVNEFRFRDVLN